MAPSSRASSDDHFHAALSDPSMTFEETVARLFGQVLPPQAAATLASAENASPSALSDALARLPPRLPRPPRADVSRATLASINPAFAAVDPQAISGWILDNAPALLAVLSDTRVQRPSSDRPTSVPVVLPPSSKGIKADPPSHVLALLPPPHAPSTPTRLVPVHAIVLASQCAHFPPFPTSAAPSAPSSCPTTTLPIVPVQLPAPHALEPLLHYLYTHSLPHFLRALLPGAQLPGASSSSSGSSASSSPPKPGLFSMPPDSKFTIPPPTASGVDRASFSRALAQSYTSAQLAERARTLHDAWRNAAALGLYDARLWGALDLVWGALLGALAHRATHPRPKPPLRRAAATH